MTTQPTPSRTYVWDGTPTLPDWLPATAHRWDDSALVICHPDGDTLVQAGWTLVMWSDGMVTVASPRVAERVHGPGGLAERAEQLAATLREVLDAFDVHYMKTTWTDAASTPTVQREHLAGWRAVLDQPKEQ